MNLHLPFIFIYIFLCTLLINMVTKQKEMIKKEIKKINYREREREKKYNDKT